jgi:hypothetical protein
MTRTLHLYVSLPIQGSNCSHSNQEKRLKSLLQLRQVIPDNRFGQICLALLNSRPSLIFFVSHITRAEACMSHQVYELGS